MLKVYEKDYEIFSHLHLHTYTQKGSKCVIRCDGWNKCKFDTSFFILTLSLSPHFPILKRQTENFNSHFTPFGFFHEYKKTLSCKPHFSFLNQHEEKPLKALDTIN